MCGRFVRTSPREVIGQELGVTAFAAAELRPRYNICPGEEIAAVIRKGQDKRLGFLRWGLVPCAAKDSRSGARMINARAETLSVRPAFRAALRRRRCWIVADGFYEWRGRGSTRTPYFIRLRSRRPLAFAGLWERWRPAEGEPLFTCTIVTCPPNELVAEIHDRMPAILDPAERELWLDPGIEDPRPLLPLLRPYPAEEMEAYPVSRLVNSQRHDSPACLDRAAE